MEATATIPTTRNLWDRLGVVGVLLMVAAVCVLIAYIMAPSVTTAVMASTVRQSVPLILGALCGLIGERTGVINIGIEGQMLLAAFVGFLTNVYTGNLFLAVLIGMLTGAILGSFLAFMSVTLKMDQIIGGTIINLLAVGLTGFFYVVGLSTQGKIQPIPLGPLADIPFFGTVLFSRPPITYTAIILVFVVHYVLFYTRWGLRSRSVGEHPSAADTVGINVFMMRYVNVTIAGGFAGLAGAYLSLEAVGSFEPLMTNGKGFIALAVMIFGKWTPFGAWAGALLFGLLLALATQAQFMGVPIPPQFVGMLPFVITIIVLAGAVGRARPPAAIGQPYEKE